MIDLINLLRNDIDNNPNLFTLAGFDGKSQTAITFKNYLGEDKASTYVGSNSHYEFHNSLFFYDYTGEFISQLDSDYSAYYSNYVAGNANGVYEFDGDHTFTFKQ